MKNIESPDYTVFWPKFEKKFMPFLDLKFWSENESHAEWVKLRLTGLYMNPEYKCFMTAMWPLGVIKT